MYPTVSTNNLKARLAYMVKTKKILNPRRGVYAKDGYNPSELANRLYSPSYISLQTVLEKEGIIFQPSNSIYLISYLSRQIIISQNNFIYKKIKDEILTNPAGILTENGISIASKERAFLDTVFLYKDFYVDNFDRLDPDKIKDLLSIYKSKSLERRLKKYV